MACSETSNVVRVGDGGTDEKTGGGDGGSRVEDVTIFIRSDTNGQKTLEARLKWYGHVRRKYYAGVCLEKDVEGGVARKEETGKTKKEFYGCGERGHG